MAAKPIITGVTTIVLISPYSTAFVCRCSHVSLGGAAASPSSAPSSGEPSSPRAPSPLSGEVLLLGGVLPALGEPMRGDAALPMRVAAPRIGEDAAARDGSMRMLSQRMGHVLPNFSDVLRSCGGVERGRGPLP